ncbi:hypothetical protein RHMOL_Rhmol01G0164500 [Rhododendron molle]|uniref:Uncharacterized protein n=1 Tax=Rhododendron molle TaxID=49168 RepID=A0ACC0Q3H5_RHOML|nr:hypothetical protein RHMOL_Rhmol01G0164500 [Rhododendron molle]
MVMQCLGAICGAGVVKGFQKSQYEVLGGGANIVAASYTKGDGLSAEIVVGFLGWTLHWSCTCCTVPSGSDQSHPTQEQSLRNHLLLFLYLLLSSVIVMGCVVSLSLSFIHVMRFELRSKRNTLADVKDKVVNRIKGRDGQNFNLEAKRLRRKGARWGEVKRRMYWPGRDHFLRR